MSGAAGSGMTPTEVRLKVLANGWRPLPVAGKAPTPTDWSRYCKTAPTDGEVTFWGRSHPGAASTGLAMGAEVAIDLDVVSDPGRAAAVRGIALECFGRTPFERVGRAPKTALLYRAGPGVETVHRKATDGSDDGVDVLADGCQVVGFGLHKETHQPYAWTGEASPLDAGPDAAPVITGAQVAEFLERVESVMPLHGGSAGGTRKGGGKGSSEEIVCGASGLVVNGRERFLMNCVWRAAQTLRQAKEDISLAGLTDDAWELFSHPGRGADLSDGKWTKADAAYKAKLTLRRVETGKVDLSGTEDAFAEASSEPIAPTYPDNSVPIAEARAKARAAIEGHFAAGQGVRAIKVSTGVGKTRIAAEVIAADVNRRRALTETGRRAKRKGKAVRDKRGMLFAVPTHKLGDEVEGLFSDAGVTSKVFRGRSAPDPGMAGTGRQMCLDHEATQLAFDAGLTISTSCCKGKNPKTDTKVECKFYHECGYQAQLRAEPDVWIAAHQILFQAQAALGDVAGVVIDEGFWEAGLRLNGKGLTLDEVGAEPAAPPLWLRDTAADIAENRRRLALALRRQNETGGVRREHLAAEGLDADFCAKAYKAEWDLKPDPVMWPGMPPAARRAAARLGAATKRVHAYAATWDAARELLHHEDPAAVSGRLFLVDEPTAEGVVRLVRTRGVRRIAQAWRENSETGREKPTLIMDATMPTLPLLQAFYPDVEVVADIEAAAPFARVTQILGAPTSANKLHRSATDRNHDAVRRAILLRWAQAGRPSALVVAQEKTETWLRAAGMPAEIDVRHFHAVAGLDVFKSIGLLVIVGRTLPNVLAMEAEAGAVSGVQGARIMQPDKGGFFYDKAPRALRMAGGAGHPVQGDQHPDPIAEAIRWQAAEAEVMQAIGRARGVNRTAENPVEIVVLNDLCLPLTVNEVVKWDDVPAGREADMVVDGIALESPSDMAEAWPGAWENAEAARQWRIRSTSVQSPIEKVLYRRLNACGSAAPRPAPFRYQHPGPRQKWRLGWYLPDVVADPCAWLEARLGVTLAGFEYLPDDAEGGPDEPAAGDAAAPQSDGVPT